jgi:glyoxylase I family protein
VPILNLVHVNLHTTDLERSIAFYERLGWKVMFELARRKPVELGAVGLAGGLEHGGGRVLAVVLSLGDDPRCATKIELMQYVDPPATPKPPKPKQEAGTHRIAMRVRDLDGTVAQLRASGVEIRDEPHEIRSMGGRQRFVLFPDPDGNLLELIELYRD